MNRRKFLGAAAAGAGVSLMPRVATAAEGELGARVRRCLDRALAAGSPSVVCGVIRGTQRHVAGASKKGPAPGGRTVFQLGSITKTLTATALARAVCSGRVRLDSPLVLPPAFPVPRKGPRRITLADLATHTSGLPSLPPNLLAHADPYDPYAHYRLDDVAAGLAETALSTEPGSTYQYSNLGYGLLGQALAFDDVDAMLRRKVAVPLRLTDTTTTLRPDMASRKAVGHLEGEPVPDWHDRVLSGAGTSMFSTADDMIRYLDAQLRPERSPLRDAIELTQRPHFTADQDLRIGLGWHISTLPGGRTMTWHNGGTGGFSTCAAFERRSRTAVVMMVNTFSEEADDSPRPVDALTFGLLAELIELVEA
ncbi:beta-lactamase family protein [Streptomyces ferrugineus]|uniref:Beta-lactamase family protein n=1 Tax=Streptomyces ferrugineus TaxID=1413221 RepID=A0A7M2SMF4_9ACTN|nr:serine hydrolase domain-containing protein [Streptomyces ferrugineus]QOV37179.1 beta-lactamase family protein [Streptomyces ferrugineus]